MADLTGQQLGQYLIGKRIGKGGMATVYHARQESMERDVAIKVMATDLGEDDAFVARFEREARVIAQLQHPHILPVYDFGREGDLLYLVMQLVTGGTLHDFMARRTLTLRQVVGVGRMIAAALTYAHKRNVIHRDLKPKNVLLDGEGNVYLADFGIARVLASEAETVQRLTATGAMMGTPAYMAPEQWQDEGVDNRTDIYALGAMLFEMIIGQPPFSAANALGVMYQHLRTPPPPLYKLHPLLSSGLDAVLQRAMAKAPEDRYAEAAEVAVGLQRAVQALPSHLIDRPLPRVPAEKLQQLRQQPATQPAPSEEETGDTVFDTDWEPATLPPTPPDSSRPSPIVPISPPDRPDPPSGDAAGAAGAAPSAADDDSMVWVWVGMISFVAIIAVVVVVALLLMTRDEGDGDDSRDSGARVSESGGSAPLRQPTSPNNAVPTWTPSPSRTPRPTSTPVTPTRTPLPSETPCLLYTS
ncbi:MAG: serine/threonine protein kinase, partial [Chloroflexi bacterium]|nr:serine/threonine protein kinase [Chloroflexota bacterium]